MQSTLTSDLGRLTFEELHHQAEAAGRVAQTVEERAQEFKRRLPLSDYSEIVFTGCGSSYHVAECAAFAWSQILSRPCRAVVASELAHFGSTYLDAGARPLLFAVSRTGGTEETIRAVQSVSQHCRTTSLALTTEAGGELASACDLELALTECAETSVVTTQGFTCMLYALLLLADWLTGERHRAALETIPKLIAGGLVESELITRELGENLDFGLFVFLGSGPFRGLASESALKMTEMSLSFAQGFPTLEFRHGPKALLDGHTLVTLFAAGAERPFCEILCREIVRTGAHLLIVGDIKPSWAPRGEQVTALSAGEGLEEMFQPVPFAQVVQQMALWRSRRLGLNADAPRHLAKTVRLHEEG